MNIKMEVHYPYKRTLDGMVILVTEGLLERIGITEGNEGLLDGMRDY